MTGNRNWRDDAACLSVPDAHRIFFAARTGGRPRKDGTAKEPWAAARAYCATCPVRVECLTLATEAETGTSQSLRFGFFGGATPQERFAADPTTLAAQRNEAAA